MFGRETNLGPEREWRKRAGPPRANQGMGLAPMQRLSTTGLKTSHLAAQSVRPCLPEGLPYNWDEKLRELVVGICLSRSLLLQSIAQTRPGHVRTNKNVSFNALCLTTTLTPETNEDLRILEV